MSYIFNPFIENLDKVSGLVTGIQFVGVIRNANLNPGYPSGTPEVNQAWLVADSAGTVGGQPVSIGDIVLYTVTGWEIIPNGTVTIPLATEILYGSVRIATLTEVEQGSIDDAAITPLKLFNYLQSNNFGESIVPQLFARLLSDGSVTITDNTTTITFSLPLLGTAGTYGSPDSTLTITTDDRGRVTGVTSNPILIDSSQVSDLATYITNNFATLITSTTLDVAGGTINLANITTAGTYGNASNFPIVTVDQYGRVTSITTTSITGNPNFVEDVQDIIGTSLNSTTLNISYDDPSGFTTINIPNTSVTPGNYGNQSQIATFTVNSQGRITSASNVNINIVTAQIGDFVTGVRNILSTSVGNTSNVALTWNPGTNQIFADLTNVGTLGTYGSGNQIPVITTDVKGRVTNVGLVNINWAAGTFTSSQVTDFVESAQDAVGNILTDSSEIDFQYNDTLNQITAVLQPSGVTAGTYTKVTVDSKGRVTSATFLTSSDIPVHNHDGSHITSGIINVARLGVNPQPNTFLRGDGQFATVTPTFGNQSPNTVFAGPSTAPSSQPLFRALVNNDLPISPVTPGTYGSTTLIPVITVNDRGIITGVTTTTLTAPDSVWGSISGNILNQLDLIALLGNYQLRSENGQPNGYASLDGSGRLPSSQLTVHNHGIGDIVGLQTALDAKADINHTHISTDITDFQEAVQDVVGTSLVEGTGINITYNDLTGEILIENTQPPVDPEVIQDTVGQLFAAGVHQNITFVYDDTNNQMNSTVTIDLQAVTDNGNITNTPIIVGNVTIDTNQIVKTNVGSGGFELNDDYLYLTNSAGYLEIAPNRFYIDNGGGGRFDLLFSNTTNREQLFQDASGTIALLSDITAATGNVIRQNGNSFGANITIGSNDNFALQLETNGTVWQTISNDGRFGIGTSPVGNTRIVVNGLGNTFGSVISSFRNNSNLSVLSLRGDGTFVIGNSSSSLGFYPYSNNAATTDVNGENFGFFVNGSPISPNGRYTLYTFNQTQTSGNNAILGFFTTFSPSSGSANMSTILVNPAINQTGGANGITRAITISPTLTSAADWRSIEWTNNTGWGLYGSGTAPSVLNGNLGVGTLSIPADTRMVVNGTGNTFTTVISNFRNNNGLSVLRAHGDGTVVIGNSATTQGFFTFTTSQTVLNINGENLALYVDGATVSAPNGRFAFHTSSIQRQTTGDNFLVHTNVQFAPTSGNANFGYIGVRPEINQTGGANGTTWGVRIAPTLTAASDWRSVEFTNNTGRGIWGSGTAANALAGSLSVGTLTTDANTRMIVQGTGNTVGTVTQRWTNSAGTTLLQLNDAGVLSFNANPIILSSDGNNIQIGRNATASGTGITAIAIGRSTTASASSTLALGFSASATVNVGVAVGVADSTNPLAAIIARHNYSIAIGSAAQTSKVNQIVFGRGGDTGFGVEREIHFGGAFGNGYPNQPGAIVLFGSHGGDSNNGGVNGGGNLLLSGGFAKGAARAGSVILGASNYNDATHLATTFVNGIEIRPATTGGAFTTVEAIISARSNFGSSTFTTTNSQIEINSTNRGFLPPRLTTAERDAVTWTAADAGMVIFNTTTNTQEVYNGTSWISLGGQLTLSVSTLSGRGSGSGSGVPEPISLGTGLIMSGTTLSVNTSTSGGGTSPSQLAELQESFNDYQGQGNASSSVPIGGGIGFFSSGMAVVGTPVTNPNNAIGVYLASATTANSEWNAMRYNNASNRSIISGNLNDKVNYFIIKRRMRLVSFTNNRSFHHGIMTTAALSDTATIPATGVFFRWQTDGTTVVNFEAHVRNSGVSTIVTPTSQPANWNDWFVLEIRIGASGIQFFIDNTAVTGLITTNIPTALPDLNAAYVTRGWAQSTGSVIEIDWDYARPNI